MQRPSSEAEMFNAVPSHVVPVNKVWIFPELAEVPQEVVDVALGSRVVGALLVRRGIKTADDARSFLDESSYVPTKPSELPDVERAVARISKAIDDKQNITIYGDYDVDGTTGTSVLYTVLKSLGASVDYYIPNRISEGYGLNLKAISVLASKRQTRLIITCDCGVSNFAEINFAKSLGVDSIVLDHHTMPEVLPPAVAIVHPKLLDEQHPLFNLPGVGVAYKVCEALLESKGRGSEADELLDYVTLGMIADLVPLVAENRYLVKIGLEKLVDTKRIGLKALLSQVSGGQQDTDLVGFGIAPRINAAGRLSDALKAVELLTTTDEQVAEKLAHELQVENTRRQELCEQIFTEADHRVQNIPDFGNQKCIAIYDRNWHHGVVGIVASRLVEKYHRPVFIGQFDVEESVVRASARGVEQLDLFEVLKANEHLLQKFGGHKMAAGFTVEARHADELCRALAMTCERMLAGSPLAGLVEVDLPVTPEEVSLELARQLKVLAPFGMGNRKPRLAMRGLRCVSSRALGKEAKHSRIMVSAPEENGEQPEGRKQFECVMWNSAGRVPANGQEIDLVFTADVNHFNGKDRLQLVINDWRPKFEGKEITNVAQMKEFLDSQAPSASDIAGGAAYTPPAVGARQASANQTTGSPGSLLNNMAKAAGELTELDLPVRDLPRSTKQVWHDLRANEHPHEVLRKGLEKLGGDVRVFNETSRLDTKDRAYDRTAVVAAKHLILWQYPPTLEVFKEVLSGSCAEVVYLVGYTNEDYDDPSNFIKRLYGLVRYAVNQKDGSAESDKLTALMGASKLAVALGLGVLKRTHLIDWYAEDGSVFLELLEPAGGKFEDCEEFTQLSSCLKEIRTFRNWCSSTPVKDILLALVQHGVSLAPQIAEEETSSTTTGSIEM